MNQEAILYAEVRFFSPGDEAHFFLRMQSIGVKVAAGRYGGELSLSVPSNLTENQLLDLLNCYRRYELSMKDLIVLKNNANKMFFASFHL